MRIPRQLCRHPKKWVIGDLFRAFFIAIISISVFVAALLYFFSQPPPPPSPSSTQGQSHTHRTLLQAQRHKRKAAYRFLPWEQTPILSIAASSSKKSSALSTSASKCSLFTCLDIHRCGGVGVAGSRLSIYLYPLQRWEIDGVPLPPPSKLFLEILNTLRNSVYWVERPEEACILIPTIDTLHLTPNLVDSVKSALASLPFWGLKGGNHLLFTFSSEAASLFGDLEAILASSAFPTSAYRPGFNIPLLVPNPFPIPSQYQKTVKDSEEEEWFKEQKFIAVSPQPLPQLGEEESVGLESSILILDYCSGRPANYWERCRVDGKKTRRIFSYPQVLQRVDFCIIWRDLSSPLLWDVLSVGCIPVIVADSIRLPFDDVIDWSRLAILVYEKQLGELPSILRSIGKRRRTRLQAQVDFIFNRYFKNITLQTETVLEVLQDRIFSHHARTLQSWNHHPTLDLIEQPLFNPGRNPGEGGFTAVILAYERVPSLFQVISQLDKVPSLSKIIVVWNNQNKRPPIYSSWPPTNKSIKVIQMSSNKMSNRFFPFDEIETEAVFSLDDDIIMLTADEVEFGFQTWKEFPERLVGFPSRSHVWDNVTLRWRYESEWTNQVSMVLTGAAFYHKYWHHAFSHEMPASIRALVDEKMNCEDIAINFLVAATTGQPPIKVTPRKKFKCPTCSNSEMLSSSDSHMIERSDCINQFAAAYGYMPLLPAEWRADPVLYLNDAVSAKLKKFKDVGTI